MANSQQLSRGSISRFMTAFNTGNEASISGFEPVIQVLSIKKVAGKTGDPTGGRNRLIISDGIHFAQSMLATQHNALVDNGTIQKFSLVRLKRFHANSIQGKRLIILLDVELVVHLDDKIGEPKSIEAAGADDTSAVPSPAPVQALVHVPQQALVHVPQQQQALVHVPQPAKSKVTSVALAQRTSHSGPPPPIYPIDSLSPYQNKWTIKARVTQKSEIRTWSNPRGEGKLFNVTLMDETGEIRATGFNAVVDELYDKLQEGKVYFISKAKVNIAKKKFNSGGSDFEISLERSTEVEECTDTANLPEVKYNFVDLSKLEEIPVEGICDVVGIVSHVEDAMSIVSKAGKQFTKRELTVVDKSQYSVRLTLWGKQAETFSVENQPVVAFKGVKVGDFNGRSLSAVSSTTMQINPDIKEAHLLRGWYDGEGQSAKFMAHSGSGGGGGGGSFKPDAFKTMDEIKNSEIGHGDAPEYFSCRGTVIYVKVDNLMYPACPNKRPETGRSCSKKVTQTPNGDWRCENCDQSYPAPDFRYIMSINAADHTNQLWLQAYNEVGETLLGISANDLHNLQEENLDAATNLISKINCKTWNFNCSARQDTWQDVSRVRYNVQRVAAIDFKTEGRHLAELLQQY